MGNLGSGVSLCRSPYGRFALATALVAAIASPPRARAWDEDGHAIVTHLAFDVLPAEMPAWLRSVEVRTRLVYLSSEPDRWRGQHNRHLDHINGPEHYIDEEKLHPYGLSLKSLPPLRGEFTDRLATTRAQHPERFPKPDVGRDRDYTALSPGLLPYRIAELQWKIAAGWTQLKTYEAHRDHVTDAMIDNARQNIVYHMGILGHYVGDGTQPLHITEHHHGWFGPNPKDYTTDRGFHGYIDGDIVRHHNITYDALQKRARPPRPISTKTYWSDICGYLFETYEWVEPLYELEKTGKLREAEGKTFIEERLLTGGAALAGVWVAAYKGSRIDDFRVRRLKERYPREPGRAPVRPAGPVGGKP